MKLLDNNEIDFAIGRFEMVSSRFGSIELLYRKICLHDELKTSTSKREKVIQIEQYLSSKRVAPAGTPVAPIDRTLSQLNLEREIFCQN